MKLAAMAVVILAIVIVVGFAPMTPALPRRTIAAAGSEVAQP